MVPGQCVRGSFNIYIRPILDLVRLQASRWVQLCFAHLHSRAQAEGPAFKNLTCFSGNLIGIQESKQNDRRDFKASAYVMSISIPLGKAVCPNRIWTEMGNVCKQVLRIHIKKKYNEIYHRTVLASKHFFFSSLKLECDGMTVPEWGRFYREGAILQSRSRVY